MPNSRMGKPGLSRKQLTHDRIVDVASKAIRRSGYDGTGVAEIMKDAGLTHGGFYAHFKSRDDMLAEAVRRANSEAHALAEQIIQAEPQGQGTAALVRFYLSKDHQDAAETGCPMAALGSEMPRQSAAVRQAATDHIKDMIDLVAKSGPRQGEPHAEEEAIVIVAAAVGALMLARGVDDPALSKKIRDAVINRFGKTRT